MEKSRGSGRNLHVQGTPLDYPQWRGTNRDGSASSFVQPTVWPDALTRPWRVPVGEGYASPIVLMSSVVLVGAGMSALPLWTHVPFFKASMITGLTLPYILLNRVLTSPGFLDNAAGNAIYVRAAVLLLLLGGATAVGITIAAYPVLRQYSGRLAISISYNRSR